MVVRAARRTRKTKPSRRPRPQPAAGSALRELRAEVDRLRRKVDNLEAEMRRLRRPIHPAFPDVQDESE